MPCTTPNLAVMVGTQLPLSVETGEDGDNGVGAEND